MSGSQFNISAAVRNAYLFLGREWAYLGRASLLPVGVTLVTDLLVYKQGRDITIDEAPPWNMPFELFLWDLPSSILFGWFMFREVRLLLLGERANFLPQDVDYLSDRRRSLQVCVIVWLLFNMAQTVFGGALYWALGMIKANPNSMAGLLVFFLFGISIWGIRFGVVHILAAVGYPIRNFIFRVNGLGISLRLIGMTALCVIPVFLLVAAVGTLVVPENAAVPEHTTRVLIAAHSLFGSLIQALLTAASAFALKEILGRPRQEKAS